MFVRKIVYGLLLFGMMVFHIFYSGAIAWYLLILTVIIPAVSLLITLPARKKINILFDIPESVNVGDKAAVTVKIKNKALTPIGCASFYFAYYNGINGRGSPKKNYRIYGRRSPYLAIPVNTGECGRMRCEFTRFKIYDYLGIFERTYKVKETLFMNVFPIPTPPSPIPALPIGDLMGVMSKPKPGGGFAEDYDIRGYRPGDPVNLIHWKLTSKRDDLMIREPLVTERGKALLTFDLYGDSASLGRTFAVLAWCVLWLLQYSVQPHIKWYDDANSREQTIQITSHIEFIAFLIKIFAENIPRKGSSVAHKQYEGFAWRYHVSAATSGEARQEAYNAD